MDIHKVSYCYIHLAPAKYCIIVKSAINLLTHLWSGYMGPIQSLILAMFTIAQPYVGFQI